MKLLARLGKRGEQRSMILVEFSLQDWARLKELSEIMRNHPVEAAIQLGDRFAHSITFRWPIIGLTYALANLPEYVQAHFSLNNARPIMDSRCMLVADWFEIPDSVPKLLGCKGLLQINSRGYFQLQIEANEARPNSTGLLDVQELDQQLQLLNRKETSQ